MLKKLLLPALTLGTYFLHAQTNDSTTSPLKKELSLLTAIGYSKNMFIDIGLAVNRRGKVGHHPFGSAYFISSELYFDHKKIVAPKIGAWAAGGVGGIALGINMVYYTDFVQGALAFRPEVGFGFQKFKITYGYNIRLTNTGFNSVSKNVFQAAYCFRLKSL